MSERTPRCTWDAARGWLTPEHTRDCADSTCAGCRPCPKTHCAMRGRCAHHVNVAVGEATCPSCIGRTRADLRAIVDLYAVALPEEAEANGVDSEALSLSGPAAIPEHVHYRQGFCEFPKSREEHHPYTVLGGWDLALRETYGPPTDLNVSVVRAADYLEGLLAGAFPHGGEFEDFAASLSACRAHLESVIHDSRTPERGRPCPRCAEASEDGKGPKLRKRYAEGTDERTKRGDHDTWHCPADPEHWWSEVDYRSRVEVDYVRFAKLLPARELAERLRVPASTVRSWIAPTRHVTQERGTFFSAPKLSAAGVINGRTVYSVETASKLLKENRCDADSA